ncbi:MAG: zinc ribbon domain-containing protein [Chloroflexota bacterium]|nr:MAG: hypothetical protein DIU80_02675 [Chloroflexota bacterium]
MPFCPQCGVDNPEGARFCDQCGAMLIPVTAPAAQPAAPAQPAPGVASGVVTCPQCGTQALPGEAFCDNCGAPLSAPQRPVAPVPAPPYSTNIPPQQSYPPPQPVTTAPPTYQAPPPPATPTPSPAPAAPAYRAGLAPSKLIIADTGATIPLPNAIQAIVGRADPVSQFFPDVDLTPHGALDNGVGRRQARIFVSGGQVMIEDLDSTNGTSLNGRRLAPRQPQPLRDGDQILLGKLALRYSEY